MTGVQTCALPIYLFPCLSYNKTPAFNTSKSGELWVMLIEKAYAKINGGFDNIVGGLIRETLKDLTGAPAISFFNQEGTPESHWNTIQDADKNRFIMGCGSDDIKKSGNDSQDTATGLAGNHAYSLLGAYEIVDEGGRKRVLRQGEPSSPYNTRLVKLRNPWGEGEWKGDWGDKSYLWTPELRREVGVSDEDDGVFCMPFNMFQKYFYDYQVCYFYDDYKYSAQKFKSGTTDPTIIKFTITSPGEYYFTVNQINRRMFRKTDGYTYSQLTLFVAKQENDGSFSYKGSVCKADKEMWFKSSCQPGNYIAYVLTPWKRKVNEFSFSTYGPNTSEITNVPSSSLPSSFLECIMVEKAKADKKNLRTYADQGEPNIFYKFENGSDGLGFFYFSNKSGQSQLTATIEFTDLYDTDILPPYSGTKPQVIVSPNEDKVLLYRMNSSSSRANFKMMASFKKQVEDINRQVKLKGTRLPRTDEFGNETGINLYVFYHAEGLAALYENTSYYYSLVEDVRFYLRDCKIEGISGSAVKARVGPGQSSLINIVKTGSTFAAQVTYCTYQISKA